MSTTTATAPLIHADATCLTEASGYTGGPDYNLASDHSRRATWQIGPHRYLSITVTGFVNGHILNADGGFIRNAEFDDLKLPLWDSTEERTATEYLRPHEDAQVEYYIYDAPNGPDGEQTELNCDYETCETVGYLWPGTIAKAEANAAAYVMGYDFARDFDIRSAAGDYWQL